MPTFSNNSGFEIPDLEIRIPNYSSTASSNTDDYVCISIPSGLNQDRRQQLKLFQKYSNTSCSSCY